MPVPQFFHRDGAMRVDGNYGSTSYEPNSYGEWMEQPEFSEPPLKLQGDAYHWNFREEDDDYYTQPGLLFRLINPGETGAPLWEHGPRHCRCTKEDQDTPYQQLYES